MIEPTFDRVIVERREPEKVSKGGIHFAETAQGKTHEGIVEAVGPDVKRVKAGERVVFGIYAGTDIRIEGRDLLVLREEEVMGVLR